MRDCFEKFVLLVTWLGLGPPVSAKLSLGYLRILKLNLEIRRNHNPWPAWRRTTIVLMAMSLKLFQRLGVDLHRVFHLDPQPGLGQHIGDLEHAGGAAGGHHPALRCRNVVPLALADGR